MSRIKELRASIDKKLDALALEAQLTQTKDQAQRRTGRGRGVGTRPPREI